MVDHLEGMLGEDDGEVGVSEGAMPNRVLVNVGITWPWRADSGRFASLSWALAEERVMVPLAVPTQMLGAEVLRWLTGAFLVK